ncbi:alpha/beta hydrolase [Sphingobium sp. CAP-1]|uniref:alpha/beta hydrolase n=1 Tax=Sphingobium sp. CAP-1 TaxID=2676077 RepID=UPI0012BB32DE|nr:alpha/beta hydrolase [Sphingobium sp. CAP-1]QGP78016.1 alpha/beta hydrolase fold domain-containing protein [Sphingobium sp. CAP-1]
MIERDGDVTQASIRHAIAALGVDLGPDVLNQCRALFDAEQSALQAQVPASAMDIAYGPHERHRLDLYRPAADGSAPILVFVHGGGFLKGDKGGASDWPNANVGRMAAQAGFLGVVVNYRLAPDNVWPAGAEDVAAVITWLKANGARHGGDPDRIVLMGTSAGAVHVAGYLRLAGAGDVRAAILLSGLYGYTPLDQRDTLYYGDPALYPDRMPLEAVAATSLPLLVACAEFDPPRFQAEFLGLMQDRIARHGAMPRALILSGHNHYTLPMHLGTADRRLSQEIYAFVRETTA